MSKQVEKSKSLSLSVSKHVWVAEKKPSRSSMRAVNIPPVSA